MLVSLIVVAAVKIVSASMAVNSERELVLRGFAGSAVVVLVHQVAGEVRDVRADGDAVAPRASARRR